MTTEMDPISELSNNSNIDVDPSEFQSISDHVYPCCKAAAARSTKYTKTMKTPIASVSNALLATRLPTAPIPSSGCAPAHLVRRPEPSPPKVTAVPSVSTTRVGWSPRQRTVTCGAWPVDNRRRKAGPSTRLSHFWSDDFDLRPQCRRPRPGSSPAVRMTRPIRQAAVAVSAMVISAA